MMPIFSVRCSGSGYATTTTYKGVENNNQTYYQLIIRHMQGDIKANVLIEAENTVMHRFVNKEKSLFTSGTCKLAKIDNPQQNTVYFINLNSFYYTLNKNVIFARLPYDDTVSYVFNHFDNGLSSLTFLKDSPSLHNFEEIIGNVAVLLAFDEAIQNPEFKARVDLNCPGVQKEAIHGADKVKSTIKEAGKLLGAGFKVLGSLLAQGVSYVGEYIDKKVEEPQDKTEVPTVTKQKWDTLKQGTSNMLNVSKQLYGKYLSPLVDTGLEYGKQVAAKIDASDSGTIKYAKQLASTSGEALGTAFKGLAEGTTVVGAELGNQSRKIINKKYGEDYVKTFLPGEDEKKQGATQTAQPEEKESSEETVAYPYLEEAKEERTKE